MVVRHETYVHSYPHCWRTDTPLIYKAVSSWFVRVTALKDRMLELNQQITWVPEHVRDGSFGKWLEGARDWSISRNRYWGSPLPIWKSDDPAYPRIDVYGSLDELERDFGVRPDDLHRPFIDELVRPNPDDPTGKSMMRRIPDVLDCWFESGSMPYAQVHYPFENQEWFESHFPGDFIVEYIGQTRGWFYTLHVLATALFDRPSFKTCVVHGILLGDDGQKLSKRLANYPDPIDVFDTVGSDAMRWALLSSAVVARRRHGGRPPFDGRSRAPCAHADLERVVLPVALRERRRHPRRGALERRARPRPIRARQGRRAARRRHRPARRVRPVRRVRGRSSASSTRSTTGTSAAAAIASGQATRTRSTRCTPCSPCCAASPLPCCRSRPTACTATSPAASRCTSTSWPSSDDLVLDVDPDLVDTMDQVTRPCARQPLPCARRTASRTASRCRSSRSPHREVEPLATVRGADRGRSQREVRRAHDRRRRHRRVRAAAGAGRARATRRCRHATAHRRGQGRQLDTPGRRRGRRRPHVAARRVHAAARATRRARRRARCPMPAVSSRSTPRSRPTSRRRVWRGSSSGASTTCAAATASM